MFVGSVDKLRKCISTWGCQVRSDCNSSHHDGGSCGQTIFTQTRHVD